MTLSDVCLIELREGILALTNAGVGLLTWKSLSMKKPRSLFYVSLCLTVNVYQTDSQCNYFLYFIFVFNVLLTKSLTLSANNAIDDTLTYSWTSLSQDFSTNKLETTEIDL